VPTNYPTSKGPHVKPSYKPSTALSIAPSVRPGDPTLTPSVTPTIYDKAPIITKILHIVRNTSISFTIQLSPLPIIPGTVYCTTLTKNTTSSLIRTILYSGSLQSYYIGVDIVHIEVDNLLASTDYYTYCYVKTIAYTGSTLSQTLNTYHKVRTTCCKEIEFTNAPSTVYGDTRNYIFGTDPKQYVYSYSLSSPPTSMIVIYPMLYDSEGQSLNASYVLFRPASFTFEPNSIVLSSNFVIQDIGGTLQGNYMLALSTEDDGKSSAEYRFPKRLVIDILSSNDPLPPPKVKDAKFSNTGSTVEITFDSPTNLGGIATAYWKCSLLFRFDNVDNTNCTWISTSLVQVIFGPYDETVNSSVLLMKLYF